MSDKAEFAQYKAGHGQARRGGCVGHCKKWWWAWLIAVVLIIVLVVLLM